jgi:calcium-dependent protein kinase
MLDILNGFVELSKHDIIHGDLKPANILINADTYKLAGIVGFRVIDWAVKTPLYMSP